MIEAYHFTIRFIMVGKQIGRNKEHCMQHILQTLTPSQILGNNLWHNDNDRQTPNTPKNHSP